MRLHDLNLFSNAFMFGRICHWNIESPTPSLKSIGRLCVRWRNADIFEKNSLPMLASSEPSRVTSIPRPTRLVSFVLAYSLNSFSCRLARLCLTGSSPTAARMPPRRATSHSSCSLSREKPLFSNTIPFILFTLLSSNIS